MNAAVPNLYPVEARILGCLIEKQKTTPDGYPLTLNSLRLACNQSTNRDPVVDYDEELIFDHIQKLHRKGLTRSAAGHGSRSAKYRHLTGERLSLDEAGEALLAVLLLRGPQTPGELKTRTERMYSFGDLGLLETTLEHLIEAGYAQRIERRPGEKSERYRHLFEDDDETGVSAGEIAAQSPGSADGASDLRERVERLEQEVAELRSLLEQS